MMQGAANTKVPVLPVVHLAQVIGAAAMLGVVGVVAGSVVMLLIRWRGWAWTCGVPLLMAAPAAVVLGWRAAVCCDACAASTVGGGLWRHLVDLRAGGDLADRARDRIGPMTPYRRWRGWRSLRAGEWLTDEGVVIGFSRKGELVRVPIACGRAVMGIVVGATGSGKTILMLLLALAAIKRGSGVIFIDPKGDDYVLEQLREAAARRGRRFLPWEPLGDLIYNPYDRGSNTEIADKLLAAEVFTEPHYQRLAQRYLGQVIRALTWMSAWPRSSSTYTPDGWPASHAGCLQRTPGRCLRTSRRLRRSKSAISPVPATDSQSLPSPTWAPHSIRRPTAFRSTFANRSTPRTSSCSASKRIAGRSRRRWWARRSSRTSWPSATNGSTESSDPVS